MNMRVSKYYNINVTLHNTNLKKFLWICCLLQAYPQFENRITWTAFTRLMDEQGLPTDKLSTVKLAFSYTDKNMNQNVEVMANYVASGVQWHQSYGMMRYRGNVPKNKGPQRKKSTSTPQSANESEASEAEKNKSNPYLNYEPSERTLRAHVSNAKVKGRRGDTVQQQFSAKKIKVAGDFKAETFFMDDAKVDTPSAGKKGQKIDQPSTFEVQEIFSDSEEDEVQERHVDYSKKISASKNKEIPHRLMSPMKSSEKMDNLKLSEKHKPRQLIEESEVPPPWLFSLLNGYTETFKIFVKEEIEKAKLKPEENKKDDAEKVDLENSEEVKEDKN
jgi:hypothetical protein